MDLTTVLARRAPSVQRIWFARSLAVAADLAQIGLAPVTAEGVFSPIADGLDLFMAAVLTGLLGWHVSFVPSFIVKVLPVADLAPTWTIAVLIATRGGGVSPRGLPILPNGALPSDATGTVVMPMLDPLQPVPPRVPWVQLAVIFPVVFAIGFWIGGTFVMPRFSSTVRSADGLTYWRSNWAGALLGSAMGLVAMALAGRRGTARGV